MTEVKQGFTMAKVKVICPETPLESAPTILIV